MERLFEKQLDFAEILDLTFRIIKNHFSKLFLIVLILLGPLYLLQSLLLLISGTSLINVPLLGGFDTFLEGEVTQIGLYGDGVNAVIAVVILVILMLIISSVALPIAQTSIILSVSQIRKGEAINVWPTIKKALSRFWALLGGSIIYFLILTGLFTILSVIISIYVVFLIEAFSAGFSGGLIIHIILLIILLVGGGFGVTYFLIRWSFYFSAIVFEKVSPGLSKSWRLTRGNFWRLFALFLVLSIIVYIISLVVGLGITLLLGGSILANLLNNLVSIFTLMIIFVAYTIMYFDLRIRNEATDLKQMVKTYTDIQDTTIAKEMTEQEGREDKDNNEDKE